MNQRTERLLLIGILLLAAILRLYHVSDNPGWYTDEATHLEIVRHWQNGRLQYLAITQSTVLFSRLPLFTALLTGLSWLGGVSMTTLRLFTGSLGVLTVGLLYASVRQLSRDVWLALLAALLLAIMPPAVLYSRFGFSYNLVAPLLLLMIWGLVEWTNRFDPRWLLLAAVGLGLALITDLIALLFVPVFVGWIGWYRWRSLWVVPVMLLPVGLFTAVSLLTHPHPFLFDLDFVLFRITPPLAVQGQTLLDNGRSLATNGWIVCGLLGLFWLRPRSWCWLCVWMTLLPLVALGRSAALFSLGTYYLIPFWPLLALGGAALLRLGVPLVLRRWWLNKWVRWGTAVLVGIPLLLIVRGEWWQVNGRYQTEIDSFLLNGRQVEQVAQFVNGVTQPADLVIASPTVAWLVDANRADFQMAVAFEGVATPHLPPDLPASRWAFDPRYDRACIVILDDLWHNWAQIHVPQTAVWMAKIEAEWSLVYAVGTIQVYQQQDECQSFAHNPNPTDSP